MKRSLILSALLLIGVVSVESCGSSSSKKTVSGLSYRAFVTNPLSGSVNLPVINIVNAQQDLLSASTISLLGILAQPQKMMLSPNRRYTMIYSSASPAVALVDNTTETLAARLNSTTLTTSIALPGATQSFFVATDNQTGYAAIPSYSPTPGGMPGALVQMNMLTSSITASIPVPGAQYAFSSNDGNHVLVFSGTSSTITNVAPILVGTTLNALTTITSPNLDHPVDAIFSADGTTAYILNCGPECGGTQASVAPLDLGSLTVGTPIPVSAATTGLLNGTTLYVAGSPPGQTCPSGTAATNCGTLNIIDTQNLALANASPIIVTNGFHDHLELSADGQLFIGSHSCANVNVTGGEVRGCLSIYNTTANTVIVPPYGGDVTGIAPILGRTVVYVVQAGVLRMFDTTTDMIEPPNTTIPFDIVGQPYDVKYVDVPIPQ